MLDKDVKKILKDLDLQDVEEEIEANEDSESPEGPENPEEGLKPNYVSTSFLSQIKKYPVMIGGIIGLVALACVFFVRSEKQEARPQIVVEERLFLQPEPIVWQDVAMLKAQKPREEADVFEGKHKHLLKRYAKILVRQIRLRKKVLSDAKEAIEELLSQNAEKRQKGIEQQVALLLGRYQALDAKYSLEITRAVENLYKAYTKKVPEEDAAFFYAMLEAVDAKEYEVYQLESFSEVFRHEKAFDGSLKAIEQAKGFSDLLFRLQEAEEQVAHIAKKPFWSTFFDAALLKEKMQQKVREKLDAFLFSASNKLELTEYGPQGESVFNVVLSMLYADNREREKYQKQFALFAKLLPERFRQKAVAVREKPERYCVRKRDIYRLLPVQEKPVVPPYTYEN